MERFAKILIVEDEVFTALTMELELEQVGHEVCGMVATGEEAIESADHQRPDVVLMDIHLAGELDGIEAAETIRSRHDVSIIFVTGYRDKEFVERAKKIKPGGYLIKPVGIRELVDVIDSVLPDRGRPAAPGKSTPR